jgi:ParB-like chromosome segregation protein Spo0J
MQIVSVQLSAVKQDPNNVRLHDRENIEAIKKSLQTYKQTKPLVVWRNKIIAGNGTHEAMRELKWPRCNIVRVDYLTETEAMAYAIADNKTTDLSSFDYQSLSKQLI